MENQDQQSTGNPKEPYLLPKSNREHLNRSPTEELKPENPEMKGSYKTNTPIEQSSAISPSKITFKEGIKDQMAGDSFINEISEKMLFSYQSADKLRTLMQFKANITCCVHKESVCICYLFVSI